MLQVTLQSARWVTAHVSAVSMQFSESDQNILRALVSLLSSSLQVVTSSPLTSFSADSLESHPTMGKSRNAFVDDPYHCITDLSKVIYGKESESIPKKQLMRVVNDLLQTSSDLMLVRAVSHALSYHCCFVLILWLVFPFDIRETLSSRRPQNSELALTWSPCVLDSWTRPPRLSAVVQSLSTYLRLWSRCCFFVTASQLKEGFLKRRDHHVSTLLGWNLCTTLSDGENTL